MTDAAVIRWRKDGRYLPKFMRDFHDQKDLFKAMHDTLNVEGHEYAKDVSWVVGQCYVIDLFLWWMARHGYVIAKASAKLPFDDISETIAAARQERNAIFSEALMSSLSPSPVAPKEGE